VKLSLENAGDISALHEGMGWQVHQLAAAAGFYGPEMYPALANWVRVNINGEFAGVYVNVEQRDTQFLRNRGIRQSGLTWLYEIDDIDSWALESGDPHSPTFATLCYQPFAPAPKGKNTAAACPVPDDATLESALDGLIKMDAMLAQGAVDAFSDNPDALFSHGKNFFFADFAHSGLKRRYYPWDLDAVFRSTTGGIYGQVSKNRVTQSPYERTLLNRPGFRARYNAILAALTAQGGPLSEASLIRSWMRSSRCWRRRLLRTLLRSRIRLRASRLSRPGCRPGLRTCRARLRRTDHLRRDNARGRSGTRRLTLGIPFLPQWSTVVARGRSNPDALQPTE
jgi:hypothetical protein